MISDKEARQYILQQLYAEGYRYLARDKDGILVAHRTKPHKVVSIFFHGGIIILPLVLYIIILVLQI